MRMRRWGPKLATLRPWVEPWISRLPSDDPPHSQVHLCALYHTYIQVTALDTKAWSQDRRRRTLDCIDVLRRDTGLEVEELKTAIQDGQLLWFEDNTRYSSSISIRLIR